MNTENQLKNEAFKITGKAIYEHFLKSWMVLQVPSFLMLLAIGSAKIITALHEL